MPFNNSTRLAFIALLIALLGGCNSTQMRRAEPLQVELPQAQPQQRQFSVEIQQRYQQAIALLRQDQVEPAALALEALLTQEPDIPGAWYNLALIQYHQKQPEQALQSLQRCLDLSPRNPGAHTLNGLILRQQGQFSQARIAYAKALQSDPNFADAHLNLAILYDIYLQYFEDAQVHYQRYLELAGEGTQSEQVKFWLQDLQLRMAQGGNG
ncbi:MAG: tetratricopeptide repeat protein [Halopseudomonas sp.]